MTDQLLSCRCSRIRREVAEHHTRVGGHSSHQGEMWRSTVFSEIENSDQSISEDDDCDGNLPEDHVSLGIPAEEKGKVQILPQLDMLRDANEFMHERHQTSLLQERQADICVEDDVEFPFFSNKSKFTYTPQVASACNSDEEILSDNEVEGNCMQLSKSFTSNSDKPSTFGGDRKDGVCTWLAANADTDADCTSFHPVSIRAKRSCKGVQVKAKCKFSFKTHLHKDHIFQDEHDFSEGSALKYNKSKSTSEQLADKGSVSSIDHTYIEDDPDCLSSDSSSSEEEDEEKHQNQGLNVVGPKQKTIADQFHEALGAASINEEGQLFTGFSHTGFGLFGKLQRVMRSEKERDLYFLNRLQKEEDEASCFVVKILSKCLEGKLTVCCCSCSSSSSSSSIENENDQTRKNLMVIFSSRICGDVELDVGMLIRIYNPWKQVNVKGKQENTILSKYFSQID